MNNNTAEVVAEPQSADSKARDWWNSLVGVSDWFTLGLITINQLR